MMLGFIHRRWGQEKRREFIGLAGGAVVWPLATRAQQPDKPVIGLLAQGTSTGWNLAGSLNHPGGNFTGSISLANELFGKQIGILHELVPQASHFGVLTHPKGIQREAVAQETQSAASALSLTVEMVYAGSSGEIDAALERLGNEKRVQALLVTNDPLYVTQRVQIATLAAHYAVPAIYPFREMAESGGLLSYGANILERDRQAGLYVGRILKGENPADLPVLQMSKFELVINLKTAKALGLSFPNSMQLLADDVIE